MKKFFSTLCAAAMALSMGACAQSTQTPTETSAPSASADAAVSTADGWYEGTGSGYSGDLTLKVQITDGTIKDMEIVESHESHPVIDRAFPVIKERILEANSPVVDSVSAATFSSFAVKTAVAQAMGEAGLESPEITFATSGPEHEATTGEDVNADIVVIGGGPAGLAAAITAKQTNPDVNVIVVEKLDILSGNGKFDLNFYDVFNSEAQKAAGVEDSKEAFIEDQKDAGNTPERLEVWASEEETVDAWLREQGVELNWYYGSRNHMVDKDTYAGDTLQHGLENTCNELGVEIRTGTKGNDFVMDDNGAVLGVNVTNNDNVTYNILAQKTIIATGGFCSNKELLAKYAPGYEVLTTSNQIGTTGDFVPLFEKYGMKMENMGKIRVIPSIILPSRDLTNSGAGTIFVNSDGNRFVNERLGGLEMATAILDQEGGSAWSIADSTKVEKNANVRKQVKEGKWLTADTFEELAEMMGVDKDNFLATIEAYNKHAEEGTEDEFGQTPERPYDAEGPYYAVKTVSADHMTKGGLSCNEHAQALYEDGSVVENLYGAGEVTWQSGGYSQSVCFGRVAGREAAESITK